MKRVISALIAVLAVVSFTACEPVPPAMPAPLPDPFLDTIKKVISWLWYSPPDNTHVDCSVVIFDGSVNPNDYTADWTPATNVNAQLLPAWLTACFGAQWPKHAVPTRKASGYPNTNPPNNPDKVAVCWVFGYNTTNSGSYPPHFRCTFDRNSHNSWVAYLSLSRDGYMAVGG